MPAIARHGTPITGIGRPGGDQFDVIKAAGPRHFITSFYRPDQIEWVDENSLSHALDCGTYSFWQAALKSGVQPETVFSREYLDGYYGFARRWCLEGSGRCKWAVIPDPIGTGTQELDALLREWPEELKAFGVPVYHLDEPIARCLMLLRSRAADPPRPDVPWICIGATGDFREIGSDAFRDRMDALYNAIQAEFGRIPPIHFFRALQLLLELFDYPVWSVDSADRARNHNRLRRIGMPKKGRGTGSGSGGLFEVLDIAPASETFSPDYLWAVKQSFDRWDNLAANLNRSWPPPRLMPNPGLFLGEAA